MTDDEARYARVREAYREASKARRLPPLHPQCLDPIESERCPRCGEPGYVTDVVNGLIRYACAACTPWLLTSHRKPEQAER